MKLRIGFVFGFATGYYFGAMAGRERYEQLNRMARKVRRSEAFETAQEKAKAAVDLGVERAREAVESRVGDGHGSDQPPYDPPT